MITLWLVRHGLTDWNAGKRYQGHSDVPLNAEGEAQAQKVAARLATERLHAVITDDLTRTTHTAQAIAAHHDLPVQQDPRLREANLGLFEGLRYKDVIEEYPAMAQAWFSDPEQPPQGGEALSAVAARVAGAVGDLIVAYPRKRLALVGHDGALRLLISHLLGLPATEYWRFNVDPGSLSRINIYPGGAILIRLNMIAHLA